MWYQAFRKKRVKAGVLLYALFMAAIFSLLLQFYLHRQVAERRIALSQKERIEAYALLQLALDDGKEERTDRQQFHSGVVQLRQVKRLIEAEVQLTKGSVYRFTIPSQEDADQQKKGQKPKKKKENKEQEQHEEKEIQDQTSLMKEGLDDSEKD